MKAGSTVRGRKLKIAKDLAESLRLELGSNIVAIGLSGSVARGKAQRFSDVDMEIIIKKPLRDDYQARIVGDTYCSLNFATKAEAINEVTRPHPDIPERLGGFTKVVPLYDPQKFFRSIQSKARRVPKSVFQKAAEQALLHSYEDFCRVKNAYLNHDEVVLRDNVINVTYSASLVVACLNQSGFTSDREIFKAYKRFRKLPRGFERIPALRYGGLDKEKLFRTLMGFYLDLVAFANREGVRFPLAPKTLLDLDGK